MRPAHVTQQSNPTFTGLVAVVCMLALGAAATSHGTIYHVTKTQDTNDGACNADCSLREAILAANANPGNDVITVPAGRFNLTIPGPGENNGATGDLDILEGLFIGGQGQGKSIVDASGLGDRAIHVIAPGALVVLFGFTVTGGTSVLSGGGILDQQADLYLTNVAVQDNHAAASGGGVYAWAAEVTVQEGSVISGNSAGWEYYGGGILSDNLTITDSTVSGNQAGTGGGIYTTGLLILSGSTIAYNQSLPYDGGGIAAWAGEVEISNTTIVGNHSTGPGGAISVDGGANLAMNGVTFSGNGSPGGNTLDVTGSNVNWTNTLISGGCLFESGATTVSLGGNLESPGNTCGLVDPSDHVNIANPMLSPLASYGGPTRTLLPRLGSPAIGNGYNYHCIGVDQRGEPRSDGACDVGAVERQSGDRDPIFVDGFESGNSSAW